VVAAEAHVGLMPGDMPSSTSHQPVIGVVPVAALSPGGSDQNELLASLLHGASGCLNLQPIPLQLQCKVLPLLLLLLDIPDPGLASRGGNE
jgi:hypothetical protein